LLGIGYLLHWDGHEMNPTPNCPEGAYEFEITLDDVDLVCHLDYVPEEKGSTGSLGDPYEADIDEGMDLFAVYVADSDVDIKSLMAATYWDHIERLALIAYKDKAP
jgi:hypothetical protein